MSGGLD